MPLSDWWRNGLSDSALSRHPREDMRHPPQVGPERRCQRGALEIAELAEDLHDDDPRCGHPKGRQRGPGAGPAQERAAPPARGGCGRREERRREEGGNGGEEQPEKSHVGNLEPGQGPGLGLSKPRQIRRHHEREPLSHNNRFRPSALLPSGEKGSSRGGACSLPWLFPDLSREATASSPYL